MKKRGKNYLLFWTVFSVAKEMYRYVYQLSELILIFKLKFI